MNIKSSANRTLNSLKADLIFQAKQGFLIVYIVVALLYIIILSQLPEKLLQYAVPIIVLTDPSILGIIFIGGILMLEKEQGITNLLETTPLRFSEYIVSKAVSLALISLVVSLAVSLTSYGFGANYFLIGADILLVSVFFTLMGYIVAESCTSVNQFIMRVVPFIALLVVPCFALIGFPGSWIFYAVPTVSALKLLFGAYMGISPLWSAVIMLYLIAWDILMVILASRTHKSKFT
jgi:fluoroquinolone transport system permease protein